ncbi:hypothetical protein MMC34_002552 [Xylographa carneopallida]|nr:hypothetical protein [Xylographa carneopallida]
MTRNTALSSDAVRANGSVVNADPTTVKDYIRICSTTKELSSIASLASSRGGLLDDRVRCVAWPKLLGSDVSPAFSANVILDWRSLPKHKDEDQVRLDVNRSFIYYPKNESEQQLDRRKGDLSDVITEVLRRHPRLCYFQGFHDIVQVVLLVLGKELAISAVTHLSLLRIRDFMLPSLSPSLAHLALLPAILYSVDAKLCQHLSGTQPFFALAATLTLYAHEIEDYGAIARLFDFLLAEDAVVSVYVFAIIILSRRKELFEIPADEPEMLHFTLSKLPKPLDVEDMIERAKTLVLKHPPERLPFRAWHKISAYSVLKTTRGFSKPQTLIEGEAYFARQVTQLNRAQLGQNIQLTVWRYRRTAGGVGIALLIGLVSVWIQNSGAEGTHFTALRRVWAVFRLLGP